MVRILFVMFFSKLGKTSHMTPKEPVKNIQNLPIITPYLTNMKVQKPAVVLSHGLSSQLDYRTLTCLHLLILPPDINGVTQF